MTLPGDEAGWHASVASLAEVADRLAQKLDDGREADLAVKMLGAVMGAYLTHVWAEPEHPTFLPSVGYHQMYGTPNPDTIYRSAAVDGRGTYLLTGRRGSVPDVTIMPFGPPTAGGLRTFAPFDLDDLPLDADGAFEVQLGGPAPRHGDWWPMDAEVRSLMLRSVSERWGSEVEPAVAITRIDTAPGRRRSSTEHVRGKLETLPLVVEGMVLSGVRRAQGIRAAGTNRLSLADYSGAGARPDQWYHEGWFELPPGAGLLLEVPLGPDVRAFSLALTDGYFSTIDWVHAHSSLNSAQAVVDGDGVLRVVVAAEDPGVRNWLDTTGHLHGVVQCRWTGGAAPPAASLRVLDGAPPAAMRRADAEERARTIRARQLGAQLRARW